MDESKIITTAIEHLANAGAVGALAALMFYWYRQDRKESQTSSQHLNERLADIIEENTKVLGQTAELMRTVAGELARTRER